MTIKLHARLQRQEDGDPFVARVRRGDASAAGQEDEVFFAEDGGIVPDGYRAALVPDSTSAIASPSTWPIPAALGYLASGDIIRINPRLGELWVMYRRNSSHNAMLLTEQCNSNCVMCSQPPKTGDDHHLLDAYMAAIPLMDPQTRELGITGGEPTLLGDRLINLIRTCKGFLPDTALHMLSNGRLFNYLSLCQEITAVGHPDFMIGIPLYSDIAHIHDFVVQAEGAFDQTIRGILNLARCNQPIEIRIVLHRHTVPRLFEFARFVARNLPFVSQVAFMGLEMMGYVKMNLEALWIEPLDYQPQLCAAVDELHRHGITAWIYNHQLCTLDRELWPVAKMSISDWKNEYIDECRQCAGKDQCGGFFTSSSLKRSSYIRPLSAAEMLPVATNPINAS